MTVLVLFGFGFVITTSNAAVGINSQLNYQGKMTDSLGGTVANTAWNFRFRIYDAPTGGNLLWTERWTSTSTQVSTVRGIFSVTLGSLNSLSSVDFNSDSLYLQVHIDADDNGTWEEEFDTRKRLTAAAYAFNADEIDGINATSTNAVANYLLSLDSYGNLNLFNQGVSSTYATTSWLYVREDVQIDGNATTSGSLSAAEYYINGDKIISIDGTYNLMVGYQAYTNTGNYSTIIGSQAGANNVSNYLTAIGHTAGSNNSGSYVTVAGEGAGFMNSGIGLTGFGAYAGQENTGLSATVIGSSAGAKNTGNNLSVLGASAAYNNTGNNVTALGVLAAYGDSSANPYNNIIALGYNAKPTANNQLVVGDHSGIAYITDGYFGSGVTSTSPYAFTFHGSGGWGGDTAGADLRVVGGYGNGAGLDGNVILAHDGTTSVGKVGVGTTTIPALLTVSGNFVDNGVMLRVYQDFLSSGTVGYGHSTATEFLYGESGSIGGGLAIGVKKESSGSHDILVAHHAGNDIFKVTDGLQVGINTTTPWAGYNLAVDGSSIFIGDLIANTALGVATTTPWSGYQFAVAGKGIFTENLYIVGNATSSHFAADEFCLNNDCITSWPIGSSAWELYSSDPLQITPTTTGAGLYVTGTSTFTSQINLADNKSININDDSQLEINMSPESSFILTEKEILVEEATIVFPYLRGTATIEGEESGNSYILALDTNTAFYQSDPAETQVQISFLSSDLINQSSIMYDWGGTSPYFYIGDDLSVSGNVSITGNATSSHFAADEFCLNNDCITSWPIGSSGSSAWELYSSDPLQITPTTTGAGLYVTGTSTLATTTMAFDSKIGNENDYWSVELLDFGAWGNFPLLKPYSPTSIFGNRGMINSALIVMEDINGTSWNPRITFSNNDPTFGIWNVSDIVYNTTTDSMSFESASGGYSFDNNLKITGNATTSGWFNIGTTDVINLLGSRIGAGDLYVGRNATTTGNFTVGTSTLVIKHDTNSIAKIGINTTTPWAGYNLAVDGSSIFIGDLIANTALGVATTTPWDGYQFAVAGDSIFAGNLYNLGNATITQNLNVSGYASTTNLVLADGGSNLGTYYDLYVNSGELFFNGTQISGLSSGSSFWNYLPGMEKAISPTSTDIGIYVTASSTIAANFRVDGNSTTTGHFTVGSTLYVKDGNVSLGLATTSDLFRVGTSTQSGMLVVDKTSGWIGIGTNDPAFKFDMPDYSAAGNARIGAAELGSLPAGGDAAGLWAYFGNQNLDHSNSGNYALLQDYLGNTTMNAASNQGLRFNINNVTLMSLFGDSTLSIATSTTRGQIFVSMINSGYNVSGFNATTTYISVGRNLVSSVRNEIYLGTGGAGANVYLSSGGPGMDVFGSANGGNAGNIYLAQGGTPGSGTYGNDGTITIGNSDSGAKRNAHVNIYGSIDALTGGITTNLTLGGNIIFSAADARIMKDTSDGSDNEYISIAGGGDSGPTRGAYVQMFGNEVSGFSLYGKLILAAGDTSNGGDILFSTQSKYPMIIDYNGNVAIGNGSTGVSGISPGQTLEVYGNASTTGNFYATGDLYIGHNVTSDDDYIYFDNASESLMWDDSPGEFIFSDDLRVSGFATVTSNLHVSGYASTTNLVLADGGSNLGTYYDLYVNNGNLFFNGSQLTGASGLSFWNYLPGLNGAISPTSTNSGIYITASSTVAADFRVDGNATTTGHFEAGSTLYVKDNMVGIGIDPTALVAAGLNENALTSYKVYTNTSGANYTNYFATRIEPTAQSSAINYGITNSLTVDALENVDFAIGLNSSVNHGGQASLDGLITIQAQAELSDSGSVTTTQVIAASVVNGANDADGGGDMDTAINFYGAGISLGSNAGTVTNFYNMYLSEPLVGAGSLTNAYGIYIQNYAATATTLNYPIWTNDGQVRFDNTNTGTTTLYVTGDSYFNGNATTTGKLTAAGVYNETTADAANVFIDSNGKLFRSTSSLKYKTDINYQGIDGNLVYQLQPASYKDRNSGIEYIGFVAEDVNLVEPRLVLYDDQGNPDALHYGQFSALIVAGLKDLKSEVDDLKLQISDDNLNSITSELLVIDNPDLNINTLVVQQAATFYGTLYVQGEAGFMHKVVFEDDVEIKGKLYVDKDQAGTVKIPAGATSTEVIFEKEYKTTPKVVATLNSLVDIKYAIVEKSPFGFRLAVLEPADQEVTFDWIALATTELANEDEEANQEEEIIDETVNVEIPETSANLIKDFSISDDSIVQGDLVELQVTLEEGVENYNIAWLKNIESGEISGTGLVSHFGGTALTNTANVTVYVIISTEEGIDVASKVINIVVPETVEPVIVGPPSPSGDEPVEAGCTDQTALNYNPSANEDNGTCEYEPVAIEPMATTTDGVGGSNPWSP